MSDTMDPPLNPRKRARDAEDEAITGQDADESLVQVRSSQSLSGFHLLRCPILTPLLHPSTQELKMFSGGVEALMHKYEEVNSRVSDQGFLIRTLEDSLAASELSRANLRLQIEELLKINRAVARWSWVYDSVTDDDDDHASGV